jgi:hypothetical protein
MAGRLILLVLAIPILIFTGASAILSILNAHHLADMHPSAEFFVLWAIFWAVLLRSVMRDLRTVAHDLDSKREGRRQGFPVSLTRLKAKRR